MDERPVCYEDETTPLFHDDSHIVYTLLSDSSEEESIARRESNTEDTAPVDVSTCLKTRLYVSHFLFTWNSRVFEFGAVLYPAAIYPGTLLPMSVYALSRGLAAILFAPAVGRYIDRANRLTVVRLSIIMQRAPVAGSCAIFYILAIQLPLPHHVRTVLLAVLAVMACVEKLAAIMNLVAVERDWVVVIADSDPRCLRELNAEMRRIDLVCKLIGPLFIALIAGYSTQIAILVNLGMNVASMIVEYFAIARVYKDLPRLQASKTQPRLETTLPSDDPTSHRYGFAHNWAHLKNVSAQSLRDFNRYFHHSAFLPSFSGALLYLTVLSFAGQMVTYLLSVGYTSTSIGIARTLAVALEVAATWVAPLLVGCIGPVRTGLWGLTWQMTCLGVGTALFFAKAQDQPLISASVLVIGVMLSRLGLRGFDLSAQLIVQEEVESEMRGAFSSVESAWQNGFELVSYASTIIFSRPDQFRWPTLLSVVAVYLAGALFAAFVRMRRGHLLHMQRISGCVTGDRKKRDGQEQEQEETFASHNVHSMVC
ncbi:hypothetical protein E4T43_08695 [Aureobasidium subglaciale]|nr:hypothetical protein E4T43_08695 [Aureobasidium subglaciale]